MKIGKQPLICDCLFTNIQTSWMVWTTRTFCKTSGALLLKQWDHDTLATWLPLHFITVNIIVRGKRTQWTSVTRSVSKAGLLSWLDGTVVVSVQWNNSRCQDYGKGCDFNVVEISQLVPKVAFFRDEMKWNGKSLYCNTQMAKLVLKSPLLHLSKCRCLLRGQIGYRFTSLPKFL